MKARNLGALFCYSSIREGVTTAYRDFCDLNGLCSNCAFRRNTTKEVSWTFCFPDIDVNMGMDIPLMKEKEI